MFTARLLCKKWCFMFASRTMATKSCFPTPLLATYSTDKTASNAAPSTAVNKTTKTSKKKTKSSKLWIARQLSDVYVKSRNSSSTAQSLGIKYRSRSGFKLQQLDEKLAFIRYSRFILDLGAAPGAWTQYCAKFMKKNGFLISADLLPVEPLNNNEKEALKEHVIIQGDFAQNETVEKILSHLDKSGQSQVDTVISDMAPNTTGNQALNHGRIMQLCHHVVDFIEKGVLKPGGTLLMKIFSGAEEIELRERLKPLFTVVTTLKPDASRSESSEMYIYGRNYLPAPKPSKKD